MPPRQVDVTIKGKNDVSPAFKAAAGEAESFGSKIGKLLNPLELLKAGIAGLGLATLGELFKKSVEASNNAEAAWGRVESAVDNAGISFNLVKGDLDKLFASIQSTTRFSEDQASDAFATLMSITNDYSGSVKNLTLVSDIAIAKHLELGEAATLVGKAMEGQTAALKKQGIIIREGADVMDELRKRFQGFADRDATTMQGQLHQLANAWDEVLKAMGRALTGMAGGTSTTAALTGKLTELGTWIDDNLTALNDVAKALGEIVGLLGKIANFGVLKPLASLGQVVSGNIADDSVIGAIAGGAARAQLRMQGNPETDDDGTTPEYYRAMAQIRKRHHEQLQKELDAAKQQQAQDAADDAEKKIVDAAKGKLKHTGPDRADIQAADAYESKTLGVDAFLQQQEAANAAPPPFTIDPDVLKHAADAVRDVHVAVDDLGTSIANIKNDTITGFADAWGDAMTSMVTGSQSAGAAILGAFKKAIGGAAMAEGKANLLAAAAIAVKGLYNPVDWGRAGELFAIGSAEIALGAALGGGGGGAGAGGYRGGSTGLSGSDIQSQQQDMGSQTSTIYLNGQFLDMSDPRQAESLSNALFDLYGLRILFSPLVGAGAPG
jgi:hypothetical protein